MRRIARQGAMVVAGCVILLAVTAGSAGAYHNGAYCYYYSAQVCWVGDGYHSNAEVDNWVQESSNGTCAKAVTAAGNTRTGSGCNTGQRRISCLSGSTPNSAAYGYWADGYGGQRGNDVTNWAGIDRWFC